jgi:hypothetical protein
MQVESEKQMELADFLGCALQVIGRVAMPPEKIRKVIGNRPKHMNAFNLCNGKNTLVEIAKKARIDQGNLSRTTNRWLEQGIIFSIGEGKESRLLHIYPLPKKD